VTELAVCVVGTGRAGILHARNFRRLVPGAGLAALVDVEATRAEEAARELELGDSSVFRTLEQALDYTQIEAVVITTPTFTHAEVAVAAAGAGVHIFCEKPMALTLTECDRMIEAANRSGVVLQIGFMRRFDRAFRDAQHQIEQGLIGRPLVVRSLTRGPGLPPAWACDPRTSNGMLAEVNSHDFDTVRWLSGADVTRVFARAGAFKAPQLKERYPDFYDTAVVTLELDSGAFGMVEGICPADYGYDARAEVVGTEGVLLIGELRDTDAAHFASWQDRFRQAYLDEAAHFVACIRDHQPNAVGGAEGRAALEAVLAANQSIRTGQAVSLPPAKGTHPLGSDHY
jgi:predicted dehydrogenase